MPAVIPVVVGAVASAVGASTVVAVALGAVAGALVAAAQGESILKGALLGGLGGFAGASLASMAGLGAAAGESTALGASVSEAGTALTADSTAILDSSSALAAKAANGLGSAGQALVGAAPAGQALVGGAAAEVAAAGTGLSGVTGNSGLFMQTADAALGLGSNTGAGAATGLIGKITEKVPKETGLLSQAASWAENNPALAYGGAQVLGSGLSGMATASTEADRLAAKKEADAEVRKNSAYVKVPKTVWA